MLYSPFLSPVASNAAMHIPDGYLSPITALGLFLLMMPFWYYGVQKLRQKMNARSVPLIALVAAFTFVIMMFNVPLPGGTTGHAVGGALAAVILGPEIASIAISIALVIQAFFFGDGGILALGANCFNMAVVLPYVSYGIYRVIAGKSDVASRGRVIGVALGGWTGLTLSAFVTAVEFGIQPLLFHTADGTPLYAPYPLSVAIPAMVIPHMLVASVVEAVVGGLVVVYLQRAHPEMLEATSAQGLAAGAGRLRWLWVGVAALAIATPLGLLAPGTAWGEWSSSQLASRGLGFVPQGLARLETLWGAPLARYDLPALGNANVGYVLSAVLGIGLVALITWLAMLLFASRSRSNDTQTLRNQRV